MVLTRIIFHSFIYFYSIYYNCIVVFFLLTHSLTSWNLAIEITIFSILSVIVVASSILYYYETEIVYKHVYVYIFFLILHISVVQTYRNYGSFLSNMRLLVVIEWHWNNILLCTLTKSTKKDLSTHIEKFIIFLNEMSRFT